MEYDDYKKKNMRNKTEKLVIGTLPLLLHPPPHA
jgi:hypothetical protein